MRGRAPPTGVLELETSKTKILFTLRHKGTKRNKMPEMNYPAASYGVSEFRIQNPGVRRKSKASGLRHFF